jgi:Flp pilus assembly protein TadG
LLKLVRAFLGQKAGGSVLAFALATPVVAVGVGATVEYSSLASRHSKLQLAADTAALAATKELSLANADDARIASVVKSTVTTYLATASGAKGSSLPTITSQVLDKRRRVTVDISDDVNTFMGRILSYPTFRVAVTSAAKLYGATKLCVLTLDEAGSPALLSEKDAKLTATQCSVFSNSASSTGLLAKDSSVIRAERICLVGGYSAGAGNIAGTVLTDCPPNGDPLANRAVPSNATACDQTGLVVAVARALTPGVYCNGLKIESGANVTLGPEPISFRAERWRSAEARRCRVRVSGSTLRARTPISISSRIRRSACPPRRRARWRAFFSSRTAARLCCGHTPFPARPRGGCSAHSISHAACSRSIRTTRVADQSATPSSSRAGCSSAAGGPP